MFEVLNLFSEKSYDLVLQQPRPLNENRRPASEASPQAEATRKIPKERKVEKFQKIFIFIVYVIQYKHTNWLIYNVLSHVVYLIYEFRLSNSCKGRVQSSRGFCSQE